MDDQPTSQSTSSGATAEDLQQRIDETLTFVDHLLRNGYLARSQWAEIRKRLGSSSV
jgi:hypothetical protein